MHTESMTGSIPGLEPACPAMATILDHWSWPSTDGPVEHVQTRCPNGHVFTPTTDSLPDELVAEITRRLRSGQPDEFGERGLHVFIGAEQTWCHHEAPSADAVRNSHRALGIDLDPQAVVEVQVLP
jgi:hypothetical protein